MKKTAYEILGVSETASAEEIKRKYHLLMRNIHSDSLENHSSSQPGIILVQIKSYNDAYEQLSKGKRTSYDLELFRVREFLKKVIDPIFIGHQFDEWFQRILKHGITFCGSLTGNVNQKYWDLFRKKEQLEVALKNLKSEIEIEFMKKKPTNQIQLELDFKALNFKIAQLEQKRNRELQDLQKRYFYKFNKRFITDKKRKKLEQQLKREEEIMNAKYKLLNEANNQQRVKIELDLAEYQRALEAEFESNLELRELNKSIEQIIIKIHSLEKI